MAAPMIYQKEDAGWSVDRLRRHKAVFLWHDAGCGKTLIAILIALGLGATKVLVICPAIARTNWAREIVKWKASKTPAFVIGIDGNEVPNHFTGWLIVNYERLQTRNVELLHSLAQNWDIAIIDEHHYCSNAEAQRTEVLYRVDTKAERLAGFWKNCVLMSGTPMRNSALDLWPHLYIWAPGAVFHNGQRLGRDDFAEHYCVQEPRTLPNGTTIKTIIGSKNTNELWDRMQGIYRRRHREDVVQFLPPLHVFPHILSSYGLVRSQLKSAEDQLFDPLADRDDDAADLEKRIKDEHISKLLSDAALQRCSGIAELADELVAPLGRKALIFAHHHVVMDDLMDKLNHLGHHPVQIRGGQHPHQRQQAIDLYQRDARVRVAIVQLQVGSTAVNLTATTDELFAELSWTAADNVQCIARGYRIGQTSPVQVRLCLGDSRLEMAQRRIVGRRLTGIQKIAPDKIADQLIAALFECDDSGAVDISDWADPQSLAPLAPADDWLN